jgi:SAM-dependent methyltransferase
MQNTDQWIPTKFVFDGAAWKTSPNRQEVHVSSRLMSDLMIGAYEAAISRYATGRLADIGCGKAPLYGLYADRVDEVLCVDWPQTAHGTSFIDVFCDLNKEIDIESAHVDTVVCTDVLEHLHQPAVFFGELARICRPGGTVILGVPYLYPIHEAPHDYCRHTEFSLRRLSDDAGFDVLELTPYGGGIQAVAVLFLKSIASRSRVLGLLEPGVRQLSKMALVRRLAQRHAAELPLGYCLVARKRAASV